MEVLMFFIYAVIIFLLALLLGGTLIGYYFQKKTEYQIKGVGIYSNAITSTFKSKIDGTKSGQNGDKTD